MFSVSDALAMAMQHHQLGKLQQAEQLYLRILQEEPRHADVLHMLGLIGYQLGHNDKAIEFMSAALRLRPGVAEAHNNLGAAFQASGRLNEALAHYRQAVHFKPDYAEAYNNLGNVLRIQGNLDEALTILQQASRLKPEYAGALTNRGLVLKALGRRNEAIACHLQALDFNPNHADAQKNLEAALREQTRIDGASLRQVERFKQANECPEIINEDPKDATRLSHLPVPVPFGPSVYVPSSLETMQMAAHHFQAANLKQAEHLCRQILRSDPQHVDALHMLGLIGYRQGRNDFAVDAISAALRLRPEFAEAHNNLGAAFHALGKKEEAVGSYQRAVLFNPDYAEAHNNLGNALRLLGKLDEALASLQQALRLKPAYAGALTNKGLVLQVLGRLKEAIACHHQALQLNPNHADAHDNLAVAYQEEGKLEMAAASYRQALLLKTDCAATHCKLGDVLRIQGKLAEALVSYEHALRLKPDFVEAINNRGSALKEQGKLEDAMHCFQQALRLSPKSVDAFINLGNVFAELGKTEEALASYRQALLLKPDDAEIHYNLGFALSREGQLRQAEESYGRAIQLKEDHVSARWNRALLWLMQGDFKRGWAEYELRWRKPELPPRPFPQPLWQGEPLAGSTLLLHAEQGLGDTLQFVRYASRVKKKSGGIVMLECPSAQLRLLRRSIEVDQVLAQGETLPHFDVHAPLLRLPRLMETTSLELIPADIPYLVVEPDQEQRWRTYLQAVPGFRVGIVWRGSPMHKGDCRRSVPLKCFASLSEITGVSLISLQKGPGSEQLGDMPRLALDLGPELMDFADTAAVLKNLDLLVTVDTAVAHLAGALGLPVWVALPFVPDWRWLLDREDSPWYPSMRLFRQRRLDDWDEVFDRLRAALLTSTDQTD